MTQPKKLTKTTAQLWQAYALVALVSILGCQVYNRYKRVQAMQRCGSQHTAVECDYIINGNQTAPATQTEVTILEV